MSRRAAQITLLAALALAAGCKKKEHCERLVQLSCDHVSRLTNGPAQCDRLREQSASVDDEQCQKTLRLLKESGKLELSSGQ
jgi:hypothetical protein